MRNFVAAIGVRPRALPRPRSAVTNPRVPDRKRWTCHADAPIGASDGQCGTAQFGRRLVPVRLTIYRRANRAGLSSANGRIGTD